jgi:hypothetical protein
MVKIYLVRRNIRNEPWEIWTEKPRSTDKILIVKKCRTFREIDDLHDAQAEKNSQHEKII